MESSAGKFLARIFLSKAEVDNILKSNTVEDLTDVADSELIKISNVDKDKIEIIDIKYQVGVGIFSEEQIFCFSAMIIYKEL